MKERDRENVTDAGIRDFLSFLWRNRRFLFSVTVAAMVLSVVVSLLLPKTYRSEIRLYPSQQGRVGISPAVFGELGPLAGLAGAYMGIKTPAELCVEVLKSRTLLDRMIDEYGLMERYGEKYREDAREELLDYVTIEVDKKSGVILLAVEDRDRDRSADMANSMLQGMQMIMNNMFIAEATQRRDFFEGQIRDVKGSLSKAENEIRQFQEKTGALQIDAQARAVIEGIATLRAQIALREVQLRVLESYATPQNPEVLRLREEIHGLQAELEKIQGNVSKGHEPLMPTGRIPQVGIEYFRKLRDVKYQETLYEILSQQYEMARIEELQGVPSVQIIDRAVVPEKKYRPKRAWIVGGSTVSSFFLAVFYIVLLDHLGFPRKDLGPLEDRQ